DRAEFHEPGNAQLMGLAHTVPHFDLSGGHFALHSFAHAGVADFSTNQERGNDLGKTFERSFYEVGKLEASFDLAVWRDCRTGSGLVHRAVLRIVLPANSP